MTFSERPVPGELRRYLRRIRWVHQLPATAPYRRYPDGETELVVRFGAGPTEATLIGTRTQPLRKPAADQASFVLLRFWVGAAYPFFAAPMSELADQVMPASELWGLEVMSELREAVDFGSVERTSLALLQRMLAREQGHGSARQVRQAVHKILLAERVPSASELACELGASERHLRRAFASVVGMSPKRFLRVVRFQRALALARADPRPDWCWLAHRTGYFDQAHLIAEFRALAGATPTQLLR